MKTSTHTNCRNRLFLAAQSTPAISLQIELSLTPSYYGSLNATADPSPTMKLIGQTSQTEWSFEMDRFFIPFRFPAPTLPDRLAVLILVFASLCVTPCLAQVEAASAHGRTVDPRIASIDHWIVIYQENWSFDALYGKFPNADGLTHAGPTTPQVDRSGRRLATFPEISSDPSIPPGLPVGPFDLAQYVDPSGNTKDLVHRFYTEQLQTDNGLVEPSNGSMDKYVAWSDNPSLVMSYYDGTPLPEGKLASQYVLCDHFFHAAFGGSFLNHHFLVAAAAPTWRRPLPAQADFKSTLRLQAGQMRLNDGNLTFDGSYVVNTTYSAVAPHPATAADELMSAIENVDPHRADYIPTIGNRLDDAGVSWRWYSGGWSHALASQPGPSFQFHHQPFAYYSKYAPLLKDGKTINPQTTGAAAHLQDESQFFIDLAQGKLPAVSFIKPIGELNEHPGYAALLPGQQHAAEIVHAVQNSPLWQHTAIIITYDEPGGRWDHVPPPKRDRWGPGTRVPALVISPNTWRGGVQHGVYDTLSILKTLEQRYGLSPLNDTDAAAASLAGCFQSAPHTALDIAYTQPDADRPGRWVLIVGGTPRADQIHISQEDDWTVVRVHSAGNATARRSRFHTARLSRIEIFGQGGGDNIQIENPVTLPALVLCGSGNNFVRTGGGPSVIVGGEGDDVLEGGIGRNVVIGGRGSDRIQAGPRGDILIAGSTDYDADLGALRAILRQWAAGDVTYSDRVARLSGLQPGNYHGPLLTSQRVHFTQGNDILQGGHNSDWIIDGRFRPQK
jgi:acid phosphatase